MVICAKVIPWYNGNKLYRGIFAKIKKHISSQVLSFAKRKQT